MHSKDINLVYYCNDVIKLIRHFAQKTSNTKNISKTKEDSTLKLKHLIGIVIQSSNLVSTQNR